MNLIQSSMVIDKANTYDMTSHHSPSRKRKCEQDTLNKASAAAAAVFQTFQESESEDFSFFSLPASTANMEIDSPKSASSSPSSSEEEFFSLPSASTERDFKEAISRRPRARKERKSSPTVRSAQIITNDEGEYSHQIAIHGISYPLNQKGKGNFHVVYEFLGAGILDLKSQKLDKQTVILKSINIREQGPNKAPMILREGVSCYNQMKAAGIPLPAVYLYPDQFEDTADPKNGNFWILEKMAEEVKIDNWKHGITVAQLQPEDKVLLDFAKRYLTQSAKEKKEIINDFYPRNVMKNSKGEFCVVDFSWPNDEDWGMLLFSYLLAWSNGNEEIWSYLIADFPQDISEMMKGHLEVKKAANSGNFPVSKQV